MYIFYIETGKIKRVGHLAFAVCSFFADNSRSDPRFFFSVGIQSQIAKLTRKSRRNREFQNLILIILKSFFRAVLSALFAIQQIRSSVPDIAQLVNVEIFAEFAFLNDKENAS